VKTFFTCAADIGDEAFTSSKRVSKVNLTACVIFNYSSFVISARRDGVCDADQ